MKKDALRLASLEHRKVLSKEELRSLSLKISEQIVNQFSLNGKRISLFLPIEKNNEIDTFPLLQKALELGATVALPKIEKSNPDLVHIVYDTTNELEISSYGIPEPKFGRKMNEADFDLVFIPLLAIDKNGHRVGYGKGYYDRFLKKCAPNCTFVGLNLFAPLDGNISDVHEADVKLHACITPEKTIKFE